MSRPRRIPGLGPGTLQTWALANETLRSVPALGVVVTVIVVETLARAGVLSSEAATAIKVGLVARETIAALGPVAPALAAAAAGVAPAGIAAITGAAGAVAGGLAGLPLAPLALAAGGVAGLGALSAAAARQIAPRLAALNRAYDQGALSQREYADQARALLVPITPEG